MQNNDIIYKKGDRVSCIAGGLHIECIVVEDSLSDPHEGMKKGLLYGRYDIKVLDPITGREIWVPRNQIDYDKQYYRDKALKSLGI